MGYTAGIAQSLDDRMAGRLRALRAERGWSLDELARLCGISRATLSRLENAEVSPTAAALGKLCAAYGLTMSRLLALVEADFAALITADRQPVWSDPATGFRRRSVSPPASGLDAEVVECELPAGKRIAYEAAPVAGLEHHLILLEGGLQITVDGKSHRLGPGDCLRYRLHGPSTFETPQGQSARYLLVIL